MALGPITGGLILGGATSLLGNIFGSANQSSANKANMKIAQMNNEFNERMMDKQIAYEKEMWNANNEYNSASAQAQRWKDAGMNPTLMMGGANAGVASSGSVSAASAAPAAPQQAYKPDTSSFVNLVSSMMNLNEQQRVNNANINQINSQAEKNRAEANKAVSETEGIKKSNDFINQIKTEELNVLSADAKLKNKQADYQESMQIYQDLINKRVPERISAEIALIRAQEGEAKFRSKDGIRQIIESLRASGFEVPKFAEEAIYLLGSYLK